MPTGPKSWRLASATKGVARTADHIHRRTELVDPVGHGREGLDPTDGVDLVGARPSQRGDLHGVHADSRLARRARHDAP